MIIPAILIMAGVVLLENSRIKISHTQAVLM
jgi:hypothetical protein